MIADMGNSEPDTQDQVGHQRDTVQVDAPSDHDPEEGRKATKREDYDESHSPMSYTAEVVFLTINSHHCNNPTVSKDVIFFVIKMFRNVQKFSFKMACGSPCSEQIGSLI